MKWDTLRAKLRNAWKSTTIRVNALAALVLCNLDVIQEYLPQLQPYMRPEVYQRVLIALAIANLVLRFKTNKCLADK
jgi:hypothetical protein